MYTYIQILICEYMSVLYYYSHPIYLCELLGADLPYCRTNNLQCCTTYYFERYTSDLRKDLTVGAQSDVQAIFIPWVQAFDYIIGLFSILSSCCVYIQAN